MLAGKLFKINTDQSLAFIADKLSSFKITREDEETHVQLNFEFSVNTYDDNSLDGIIYYDRVIKVGTKEGFKPEVSTMKVQFFIRKIQGYNFLFILAKKPLANYLANEFSKAVFIRPGFVVEARIDPNIFLDYYNKSLEETRVAYFDQIDIPNVNVLALYGDALSQTDLFKMYQEHGLLWYIVVRAKSISQIIGLTRNCVITMFSKGTVEDIVKYAFDEVAPLVIESLQKNKQEKENNTA
ncbi:MAG: hypothetical protein RAK20_00690 [Conexivisphaerales archaeon]|nr:hypothetical protein [Conexivisphaerales archaeon]